MADDDTVGPESPDEDEGEQEGACHPCRQELPVELSVVEEEVDHSEHGKGCHNRHDHVEDEDHPCAEIPGDESREVCVQGFHEFHGVINLIVYGP